MIVDIQWAFRKLMRNKSISLIHIISLTAGICGFMFIFTYCYHQLTYDKYHGDTAKIFRVNSAWVSGTEESLMTITPGTVSADLKEKHPFIEAAGYVSLINNNPLVTYQNRSIDTKDFFKANQDLLSVFKFDFVNGSETGLSHPNKVILNEEYAIKILGNVNCVGELIEIEDKSYQIAGVFKSWPSNVDFNVNGLYTTDAIPSEHQEFAYRTFIKLNSNENEPELREALSGLSKSYFESNEQVETNIIFRPQTFAGLHFEKSLMFDTPKGNIYFVYIYLLTGLVLFIIVLTNQINLNFLRNADLIKSYGITRILGSSKWRVRYQNLLENLFVFFFAVLLSYFVFYILVQTTVKVDDFALSDLVKQPKVIALIIFFYLLITTIVSLLTTSISLKNNLGAALRKEVVKNLPVGKFRDYLVSFQYSVCIVLAAVLVIMYLQLDFIKNKDLGFKTNDISVVDLISKDGNDKYYYQLTDIFGSENVSTTKIDGGDVAFSTLEFPNRELDKLNVNTIYSDPSFFTIMNIPLIEGVIPQLAEDAKFEEGSKMPILINQTLASKMDEPLGTTVNIDGWRLGKVVGVVADFHYKSLHNAIEPLMVIPSEANFNGDADNTISFVIQSAKTKDDISSLIESNIVTASQFQINSITDKMMANYNGEKLAIKLLGIFSIISVLVSLLGIGGILMYSIKKRKFEIGIRKILGATLANLISLFASRMLKMIGIAVLISYPFIYIVKDKLFELYAFKIDIGLLQLFIPALIITLLTMVLIYGLIKHFSKVNPALLIRE